MAEKTKVLVVDDQESFLNDFEVALCWAPGRDNSMFEFTFEQDSSKAQEMLRNGEFDALITDRQMGEVSGIDLAKTVRTASKKPNIPIIMVARDITEDSPAASMPGNSVKTTILEIDRAGVDLRIEKFELHHKGKEILDALDNLLEEKAQGKGKSDKK